MDARTTVAGLTMLVPALAGCTPAPAPAPAPAEAFGEIQVARSGGVAGVHDVLSVRPSGVAVIVSTQAEAGRLDAATMSRLETLTTSEAFRREVARARRDRRDAPCTDAFVTSVTMGSLTIARNESCGSRDAPETPALDEILELTSDARAGGFDEPLRDGDVPEVVIRVEQSASSSRPALVVDAGPGPNATATIAGRPPIAIAVPPGRHDAFAVLAGDLLAESPVACSPLQAEEAAGSVTVTDDAGRSVSGLPCSFPTRGSEAYDLVAGHARLVASR